MRRGGAQRRLSSPQTGNKLSRRGRGEDLSGLSPEESPDRSSLRLAQRELFERTELAGGFEHYDAYGVR